MFDSFYEHPDLIFLDATVQLTRLTTSRDDSIINSYRSTNV